MCGHSLEKKGPQNKTKKRKKEKNSRTKVKAEQKKSKNKNKLIHSCWFLLYYYVQIN